MVRKKTEIRQEEIKSAVLEIISNEGFNKLSTRNLAKKVGITEGAIFRHFKSKRDIILNIMEDVKVELQDTLRAIAVSAEPANERLKQFLYTHINFLNKHLGITILLFSEAAYMNDITLKQQLNEILTEQKSLISKIVHDGKKEGIWNKEVIGNNFAMLYLGIPLSFNIEIVLNRNKVDVNDFCDKMLKLLTSTLTQQSSEVVK